MNVKLSHRATTTLTLLGITALMPALAPAGVPPRQMEAAAPISSAVFAADDGDCGAEMFRGVARPLVPSIAISVCTECRFEETERYALRQSYGDTAMRAGYIIDPLNSRTLAITETGNLPNGKPYLRGTIGGLTVTVSTANERETIGAAAGRLALAAVARGSR